MEINENLREILSKRRGNEYDVVVMYTGGKDSSYLLYLLKEVYHLRVVAAMVNNGFEHDTIWKPMSEFANRMGIPLEILSPPKEHFIELYRMLICDYESYQRPRTNHVCHICNSILWGCVAKYAYDNHIPYVVSGLSAVQLNSGRKKHLELGKGINIIAEKSSKIVYQRFISSIVKKENSQINTEFYDFIKSFSEALKEVTTVYPYLYHNPSLNEQKRELTKLNWTPPTKVDVDNYISSGCRIMGDVIYELEKLGIITLNEREETRTMISNGQIEDKFASYADYNSTNDAVNVCNKTIRELDIKDFLIKKSKEQNKKYIIEN